VSVSGQMHGQATRVWAPGHEVQFYQDDARLCDGVGHFLTEGVRAGQPAIVIATPSHRQEFAERMRLAGIDPDRLAPIDLVWLDARETLSAFMEGGRPNAELFHATVGNVFEKVIANRRFVLVRAYGEMVDLLWRDGKAEAALELEDLWNTLAGKYKFFLLCVYAKESLVAHGSPDGIERVCACHSSVLRSA
jgi:DcmR-like sensory protein